MLGYLPYFTAKFSALISNIFSFSHFYCCTENFEMVNFSHVNSTTLQEILECIAIIGCLRLQKIQYNFEAV